MNSFTLIGNLTRDPEPKGREAEPICRLRLAEARSHPDHPLYINVSVFGAQAPVCLERLRKGDAVAVVGRLRFREWKRVDLSPRSEHWVAADQVDFLSPPREVPEGVAAEHQTETGEPLVAADSA
jgi:single stranded DNA-binding protein